MLAYNCSECSPCNNVGGFASENEEFWGGWTLIFKVISARFLAIGRFEFFNPSHP